VLRPAERLSRTPDTMQDNGELSGHCHLRLQLPDRLAMACPQSFKLKTFLSRDRIKSVQRVYRWLHDRA
jgi:hypothetical protein